MDSALKANPQNITRPAGQLISPPKLKRKRNGSNVSLQIVIIGILTRYLQKAPTSWTALTTAFLFFVIVLLVGYMIYGAAIHIVKVEDDFHEMQELKGRAEAADVAKSQVTPITCFSRTINLCCQIN